MKCKVYEITDNLLKYRMDTGLAATAVLTDLMFSPKLYEAEVVIPGISFKLPIYDEQGKTVLKKEVVSPFTLSTPTEADGNTYGILNMTTDEKLVWDSDTGYSRTSDHFILFKNKLFADKYASLMSSILGLSIVSVKYPDMK